MRISLPAISWGPMTSTTTLSEATRISKHGLPRLCPWPASSTTHRTSMLRHPPCISNTNTLQPLSWRNSLGLCGTLNRPLAQACACKCPHIHAPVLSTFSSSPENAQDSQRGPAGDHASRRNCAPSVTALPGKRRFRGNAAAASATLGAEYRRWVCRGLQALAVPGQRAHSFVWSSLTSQEATSYLATRLLPAHRQQAFSPTCHVISSAASRKGTRR